MVLLAVATLLASGASAQDAPADVRRVVSLVPAATESLFALGAGDRVVGVSSYDHWPPEVEDLPRLGALLDPDTERILALRPDLVVVDPSQRALSRQLEALDIRSYAWSTGDLESLYRQLRELGAGLGIERNAAALVDDLRAQLATVADAATGERPTVLVVFGRRPGSFAGLWVSGGVGFLHELVGIAGGVNRFADVELQGFKAALETVVAKPPDVVVEIASGAVGADTPARVAAQWRSLPGFADVRVGVLEDPAVLVPGPRVAQLARRLAEIIRR